MTIDKAIEILIIELGAWPHKGSEDWYSAVELGIEALKRVIRVRSHPYPVSVPLLPGETKELERRVNNELPGMDKR